MGFLKKFKDIQKSVKEIKESGGLGDYLATKAEQKTEDLKQSLKEKLSNRQEDISPELKDKTLQGTENMRGEISQECEDMRREISQECEDMRREIFHKSIDMGYDEQLEKLIDLAIADGELTEKEKKILYKRAEALGVDLDEFEMVLDNRLNEIQTQRSRQASVSHLKKDSVVESLLNQLAALEKKQGNEVGLISVFKDDNLMKKKARIIKNHPLPNTKEGLLEMLALAAPQGKKLSKFQLFTMNEEDQLQAAWRDKCGQIISKARFFIKDDPDTLSQIEQYAKELEIK